MRIFFNKSLTILCMLFFFSGYGIMPQAFSNEGKKIKLIFDTDANNELDDQHALAYLLFNSDVFDIKGITVNATRNGGSIDEHVKEAERVMRLCDSYGKIPLLAGANKNYWPILKEIDKPDFDGHEAVNFIIKQAKENTGEKLIVLAVGKLTNLALALKIDPAIASKIKIVWLGSNYPNPGEYNLVDDIQSLNFVLSLPVEFEMAVVRYNEPTGTGFVKISRDEIKKSMPGLGPNIKKAVVGRHGKKFKNFGDYSVDLFNNIELHAPDNSRALYDMAAVAILKNPSWAKAVQVPAPYYDGKEKRWVERPNYKRSITYWEDFDTKAIIDDFYQSMKDYKLPD